MNRVKAFLRNHTVRVILVVVVILATFGVFAQYLIANPEVISLLFSLSPAALLLIGIAYVGTIVANAFVLSMSLRMIGKTVPYSENFTLTGYSSVVNFFGPLQSGPGFRAAYLKQRHGVSLRAFFYATVAFYGFFAAINALVLAAAFIARFNSVMGALVIIGITTIGLVGLTFAYKRISKFRTIVHNLKFSSPYFWLIGLGALGLSACTTLAYYVELLYVDPTVDLIQATIYAAAANLALFVSLTPGAIGFRESFLVLSHQLHQIPTSVVLGASIIDRAFYVVFLLLLFVALLAFGARAKLLRSKA